MVAKSYFKVGAFVILEEYAVTLLFHHEPVPIMLDEVFVIKTAGVSKISID